MMFVVALFFSACESDDDENDVGGIGVWSVGSEWWTFQGDGAVTAGNSLGNTGSGNYAVDGSTLTWRIYWIESPSAVVDFTGHMNGNTMTIRWRNNYGHSGSLTASRTKTVAQPYASGQSGVLRTNRK